MTPILVIKSKRMSDDNKLYTIDLSAGFVTLDGQPLLKVDKDVVKNEDGTLTTVTRPGAPYHVVDALMVVLDNAPADFVARFFEQTTELYNACIAYLHKGGPAQITLPEIDNVRDVLPYIGKSSGVLSTFLAIQLREKIGVINIAYDTKPNNE